jgi:GGDEF domain-containing protein
MTINQHEGYRSLNFIFLKKFSAFNKKFGWNNGNEFLKQFANELKKLYPDDMIFRYHGDDFIILSNIEKYINKNDIISINHLLNEDLECDIAHFSLSKYDDYTNFSEIYL